MSRRSMGCFLMGVTGPGFSADGGALIASVSDDPYDIRTFVRCVIPARAMPHIGTELVSTTERTLADRGYFAHPGETTRGVNECGLGFTCAMVFENEACRSTAGLPPYSDLTQGMMASCETVDQAIELFQAAGACAPAFSLLIADSRGDLAHLEAGAFGVNVLHHFSRQRPGMVFAVNCYLSKKLVQYNAPEAVLDNPRNNNLARRERGQQLARDALGQLDVAALAQILSNHDNRQRDPRENPLLDAWGYSICNHGTRRQETYPDEHLPWGTVSAEIVQPGEKLFWYAYGWPCGEPPEFGDQIYQQHSWGEFVPFGFAPGDREGQVLVTRDGAVTDAGMRSRAGRDAVSPVGQA